MSKVSSHANIDHTNTAHENTVEIERMFNSIHHEDLPAGLHERLRDTVASSLRPVKPLPSANLLTLQFMFLFVLLAAGLIAMMGISGFRSLHFGQAAGVSVILAAGVLVLSLALAWQMSPVSSQRTSVKVAAACFSLGFLAGVAILFPWHSGEQGASFFSEGWPCLATGFAVATPAALLFGLIARRGAPLSPGVFGSTIGVVAALLGVTVLQFHCVHQHAAHLLVWHGGILVAAAIIGFCIARIAAIVRTSRA